MPSAADSRRAIVLWSLLWLVALSRIVSAQSPADLEDRAEQEFGSGQIAESIWRTSIA